MAGKSDQKLKLLHVLSILKAETDEEHPLTADAIAARLASVGIEAERKSIYRDIRTLCDFGYDIVCSHSEPKGFFLAYREFEEPEIALLCDAVQAADLISAKKTEELITKLEGLLSRPSAVKNRKRVFISKRIKSDNEKIYINIDRLRTAISESKKVETVYTRHKFEDGSVKESSRSFLLSPYALTWADDHYYLISNNEKYDNLMHLRVDRITSVTLTDATCRDFREVSDYKTVFDVADYTAKAFNMFGGEEQTVTLRCESSMLEQILDLFGKRAAVRADGDLYFTVTAEAMVSDGLISWIISRAGAVELLSPRELREKITDSIARLARAYGMTDCGEDRHDRKS